MNAAPLHKKNTIREHDRTFQIINLIVFTLLGLLCLFPVYYIFICTISANDLVAAGKITFWPQGLHLTNYENVFKINRIGSGFTVSVLRTVIGTCVMLLCTSYMAYLFTQRDMTARKLWYRLTVATMYFSAGMIPGYMNIEMLGLLNSFWVYILPGAVSIYNMILTKTFMESLPASLEESAAIDGAGYLRRYWFIIFPLCKPILATVGLFTAVSQWNSFMDVKLYITNYRLQPMQYVLYEYLNATEALLHQMEAGMNMADLDSAMKLNVNSVKLSLTIITMAPIVCVYPLIQRFYVKGIMIGAVKG